MRRSLLSAVLSLPDLFVSFSFSLIFALAMAHPGQAAEFACVSGDVACLISSINTANGNSQVNTITLEAGSYTLTDVNNDTNGPNGLPSITSTLSIQGPDAETTVIERAGNAPAFRLVHVAAAGALTLEGLTLRFGATGVGGGLFNDGGTVTLRHSILSNNSAGAGAGGLFNDQGTVTISHSIVSGNNAGFFGVGGGIYNGGGTLALVNSSLSSNWAETCGGLSGGSGTSITNSTIAGNRATGDGFGGGICGGGSMIITNSTIASNHARYGGGGFSGNATLQNTILAHNTVSIGSEADCFGQINSLGNNLVGDLTGCSNLQSTDLTGDPGFGSSADDGLPATGQVYFPLLRTSRAVNAGNDAACPPTDQLDQPRVGRCDIGAIEFQDTIPPIITIAASPATLWPPNGQRVTVTVAGTITDNELGGSGVHRQAAPRMW